MSARGEPLTWRKSSFSMNGDCVELALEKEFVHIRDSKDAARLELRFTRAKWLSFVAALKMGDAG